MKAVGRSIDAVWRIESTRLIAGLAIGLNGLATSVILPLVLRWIG